MLNGLNDGQRGIVLGVTAHLIWGLAALYWIQTKPALPVDVLAHRGLWTLPAMTLILLVSGKFRHALKHLLNIRVMAVIALAACLISVNWVVFLYAVTNGKATQASFGYFLMPLMTILLGVVFFQERLTRAQIIAVVMGILGVLVQLVALGSIPLVSLLLSGSFVIYGAIRKRISVDSMEGLFLESLVIAPVALIWIVSSGGAGLGQFGWHTDIFLIGAGLFTAMPLLTHVAASRLLPLSTIGILSYIGPSLQLVVALTYLGETIDGTRLLAFVIVWIGLLMTGVENWRAARRVARQGAALTD